MGNVVNSFLLKYRKLKESGHDRRLMRNDLAQYGGSCGVSKTFE